MRGRCFAFVCRAYQSLGNKASNVSRFFSTEAMINQKITIELEMTPENAMLLVMAIQQGLSSVLLQKILSDKGKGVIQEASQTIVNQVQGKTDYDMVRAKNDLLGGIELN